MSRVSAVQPLEVIRYNVYLSENAYGQGRQYLGNVSVGIYEPLVAVAILPNVFRLEDCEGWPRKLFETRRTSASILKQFRS